MMDRKTGTAIVRAEPAKVKEVTVKSNQLQKGTVDEIVSKLLGRWPRRGGQRRMEDLIEEFQVERLRRHLLGLIARQDIEIEQGHLELKDRKESERALKQILGELDCCNQLLQGMEDISKKSDLSDPNLQAALRRAIQRIIQDPDGRGTDGTFD